MEKNENKAVVLSWCGCHDCDGHGKCQPTAPSAGVCCHGLSDGAAEEDVHLPGQIRTQQAVAGRETTGTAAAASFSKVRNVNNGIL